MSSIIASTKNMYSTVSSTVLLLVVFRPLWAFIFSSELKKLILTGQRYLDLVNIDQEGCYQEGYKRKTYFP